MPDNDVPKRLQLLLFSFGNHFSVPVIIKLIEHHAVISKNILHKLASHLTRLHTILGSFHATEERLYPFKIICKGYGIFRYQLQFKQYQPFAFVDNSENATGSSPTGIVKLIYCKSGVAIA